MFGIPLSILKIREQSDIPLLVNNLIIRLLQEKIDYTASLNFSEERKLEELKKNINRGVFLNFNDYPAIVCVKLLKYFNLNLSHSDLYGLQSKSVYKSIYYLINKTSKDCSGSNIKEAFISLYPLLYFNDTLKLFESLQKETLEFCGYIDTKDLISIKKLKDIKFLRGIGSKRKILTIDGGGMRGLIAIKILINLAIKLYGDASTNGTKRLIDNFDLIGGTSSGSIIAMGLVTGHSLIQIRNLFYQLGKKVFLSSWSSLGNLYNYYRTGDYYSHQVLIEAIESLIQDRKISELTKNVFITTTLATTSVYELSLFRSYLNPSSPYLASPSCDNKISTALRASSAAPTYFSPYIDIEGNKYLDGGLLANNPTEVAIFEMYNLYPSDTLDLIISIGTGKPKVTPSSGSLKELSQDILNIVTSSELTHTRVLEWLKDCEPQVNYYRFSPDDLGSIRLDTTDINILENCEIITDRYMNSEWSQVEKIRRLLN